MCDKQINYCVRCSLEVENVGLCPECLKKHDLKFNIFAGIVGILTLVCLYFYFVIYIENRLGFLGL